MGLVIKARDAGWEPQPPDEIRLDSQLQVAFSNFHARLRARNLYEIAHSKFSQVVWRARATLFGHIPRTQNKFADAEADTGARIVMLARQDGISPTSPQAEYTMTVDDPRWVLRQTGPELVGAQRITGYPDHHHAYEALWRAMNATAVEVEWTWAIIWVSAVLLEWVEVVERARGQRVVR